MPKIILKSRGGAASWPHVTPLTVPVQTARAQRQVEQMPSSGCCQRCGTRRLALRAPPSARTRPAYHWLGSALLCSRVLTFADCVCARAATQVRAALHGEVGQARDLHGQVATGYGLALRHRLRRPGHGTHGLPQGTRCRSTVVEEYPRHQSSRFDWVAAAPAAPSRAAS